MLFWRHEFVLVCFNHLLLVVCVCTVLIVEKCPTHDGLFFSCRVFDTGDEDGNDRPSGRGSRQAGEAESAGAAILERVLAGAEVCARVYQAIAGTSYCMCASLYFVAPRHIYIYSSYCVYSEYISIIFRQRARTVTSCKYVCTLIL